MTHGVWWRNAIVRHRFRWCALGALALLGGAGAASAEEGIAVDVASERSPMERHPFAFVVDPSTPARGKLAVSYTLGVGSGISAERPIPVVLQHAGLSNDIGVGYGVTGWFEPTAEITTTTSNGSTAASGMVGLKFQLTPPESGLRVALMTGGLREGVSEEFGLWARAAGSVSAGPLLVEANVYAERVFATGRDDVDYAVMVGASWQVVDWLRAGAEYVGQDLEEIEGEGAEGGARQAIGPSFAFSLERGRYQIVAATLFGVGELSPTALVRVGVLGNF